MGFPGQGKAIRLARFVRHRVRANTLVLMYHRVANPSSDPWDIAVQPEHFAEHLEILQRRCHVLSLRELAAALRNQTMPRGVVITFDDGYVDCLDRAAPLLAARGLPATVFVTTGALEGGNGSMWWDRVATALLHDRPLPRTLSLGGQTFEVPAPSGDDLRHWRAEPTNRAERRATVPRRARSYLEVYDHLAHLGDADRLTQIDALVDQIDDCGAPVALAPDQRTMTAPEVRRLAAFETITVGAHTVTHPFLSRVTPERCQHEITASKRALEDAIGEPVTEFSFPNGDAPPHAMRDVAAAGFTTACTSRSAVVQKGDDPMCLPRLIVRNWNGARFKRWLWGYGHG